MDLSFEPDGKRARQIDQRMRCELATSLDYLRKQLSADVTDPHISARLDQLKGTIARLQSDERISPAVFASYYQLGSALLSDREDWPPLLDQLIESDQPCSQLSIRDLNSEEMGRASVVRLYQACLSTDESLPMAFMPPDHADSARTRTSITNALALMQSTAPEMADEFNAIVDEIVLAQSTKTPGALRFDGASSYMLWGALALNVENSKSDLEMMETLAHESAHSFLFGLTIDETLVTNLDEELYSSPLRQDRRPMDGIYHATFVLARMHYAMSRAKQSGILDQEQMKECDRLLLASYNAFQDGYRVVVAHGELSKTGNEIMNNAREYMESMCDLLPSK